VQRLLREVTVIVGRTVEMQRKQPFLVDEAHRRWRLVGAAEIAIRKVAQRRGRGAGDLRRGGSVGA